MNDRITYLIAMLVSTFMAFLCGFIGGAILPYYTIYGIIFIVIGMGHARNAEIAYQSWLKA